MYMCELKLSAPAETMSDASRLASAIMPVAADTISSLAAAASAALALFAARGCAPPKSAASGKLVQTECGLDTLPDAAPCLAFSDPPEDDAFAPSCNDVCNISLAKTRSTSAMCEVRPRQMGPVGRFGPPERSHNAARSEACLLATACLLLRLYCVLVRRLKIGGYPPDALLPALHGRSERLHSTCQYVCLRHPYNRQQRYRIHKPGRSFYVSQSSVQVTGQHDGTCVREVTSCAILRMPSPVLDPIVRTASAGTAARLIGPLSMFRFRPSSSNSMLARSTAFSVVGMSVFIT